MSDKDIKLKILCVKSLTEYVVREVETKEAKRYPQLEELMQNSYDISGDISTKEQLDIGSYVCVHLSPTVNKRGPKVWVRAVVRSVLVSVGTFLYNVYLLDYGLDACVKRTAVRELRSHLNDTFVRYQAINFNLFGIEPQIGLKTEESLQLVNDLFQSEDWVVSANIMEWNSDKTDVLGTIRLSNGSDLGRTLIDKHVAIDLNQQIGCKSDNVFIPDVRVRKPKSSSFMRSANNSFVGNREHMSQSSADSIASVSSTDISIASNNESIHSVVISGSDDSEVEITEMKRKESPKPIGINGNRREKLSQLLERIKLSKELEEQKELDKKVTINGHQNECQIEYSSQSSSAVQEVTDWPEFKSVGDLCLKPAGALPPPHVLERIYTLKQQNKSKYL